VHLVDQLSPNDQEELCRNLNAKVRRFVITEPQDSPAIKEMDEIRKRAREALKRSGVTVDELISEVERVKQERFAADYPDLADAS
jgi:hypothetical protein